MGIFPRLYDLVMAPCERVRLGQYRRAVMSPASGRVLGVGVGTGLDFPYFQPGAWVIATDPDLGMLDRARLRARTARTEIFLVAADAEVLPFRDAAFDESVVGLAMCTIPHPERALAELRRALRRGGALRMLEHVRVEQPAIIGRLQDWLTPAWRRIAGGCHLNRRTVELVRHAGFTDVRATPHAGGYVQEILARSRA